MTDPQAYGLWTHEALIAEIERLTGLLAEWENHAGPYKNAEIERLRAADKVRVTVHEAEIRRLGIAMGVQADDNARLRAVIIRAKDALLDGQSTQWVHDLLVAELTRRAREPKP